MEEFVDYFQNTILPEYHGSPDSETSVPELPDWELSFDSMSPIQRYEHLEKARTITPDWNTISILKLQYSPNHVVGRWGIRFKNIYYQADELASIVHDRVEILYHKVQPPYAPSSITVIHNNRVLCEAFPAETRHLTGDSTTLIMCDSDRQNQPAREMRQTLDRIQQSAHGILPQKVKSSPDDKSQLYDMTYGPAVDNSSVEASTPQECYTASSIRKSLRFLFGDDE